MAEAINLNGVKVMVIDDSNTIRRSAEIFLVQAGCQVVLAEDGFDALAKIADHHPDIDIRWRTLHFTLSTHSAGGVTALDTALAARIEAVVTT